MQIHSMDSTKNDRIKAATDSEDTGIRCRSQKSPYRPYNDKTVSRAEANSAYRQRLNDVQEDMLLRYIDTLTERHFPPTRFYAIEHVDLGVLIVAGRLDDRGVVGNDLDMRICVRQ
jgi:hypothetical protein